MDRRAIAFCSFWLSLLWAFLWMKFGESAIMFADPN